ncbi:equilibrative nucleoside transporter 1 [Condylostylus longicornis]|uniref:equilibrative nucleoside transporter 1 n=1 Tax=Condylostylus longicornis TaxID=2530218 RepID=UPI00244E2776|nr:equilibrative nucleoside transporter 1 [Condylostylus longicornis]XP_055378757.1 equilibrative nucleoside transporter 1 [Condylostylus longicornis]XP_055378765.1 equilibrative nucleoside transporter 1 [Condylostylus longicornis]
MVNKEETDLLAKNQFQNGSSERSPFLAEPVRLTPAWEANNLPNDELNFKSMTMERVRMEMSPPVDRWKLVFLTFVLHGLGTLMPWNMFITAKSYFVDFKLGPEYTGMSGDNLEYAKYFMNYVGFAAQIPNLLFNWLNIFVKIGGNLTTRIVWSIFIEIVIFIITVVLAMSDSSNWPAQFFWVTMISVVILNMANGIYQNTVYGMAATLPFKYTGAVVLGSNVSGLFTTIISIISTEFASSDRTAAIYYFITAMFVLLVCFDTYFALPLNRFFKYHEMLNEKEAEKETKSASNDVPYGQVFRKSFPQLFNVFFVFFVTLSVFPAVHSDIKLNLDDSTWFPVPEKYFVSITCFLTFNLFAMLGSLATSWVNWPKPKYLVWPVVLRVVFMPLFLLCNYHPLNTERALPVLITSNWAYWVIAIIMSFSSGYLSSLGMMYAPQTVTPKYASTAGMFAAAMLITGIFSGIAFSTLFPLLVNVIGW